jgi:hypothetical protein
LKGSNDGGRVTNEALEVISPDRYIAVDRRLREQICQGLATLPSALFSLNAGHHLLWVLLERELNRLVKNERNSR